MEKNPAYLPRLSDKRLRLLLEAMGAVLIEGAKWCGKPALLVSMLPVCSICRNRTGEEPI